MVVRWSRRAKEGEDGKVKKKEKAARREEKEGEEKPREERGEKNKPRAHSSRDEHIKTCTQECDKKPVNSWCNYCKDRKLNVYLRTKDFGYNKPTNFQEMSLKWAVKKGTEKEISTEELPQSTINNLKHEKRLQRYPDQNERVLHRSEGIDVDEAWNSYQNTRDKEGWQHMRDWYPTINPVFTKRTTNSHRCSCDTEAAVGMREAQRTGQ